MMRGSWIAQASLEETGILKSMYGFSDYFYDLGRAEEKKRQKAKRDRFYAELEAEKKMCEDLEAEQKRQDAEANKRDVLAVKAMLERGFDLPTIQACAVLDEDRLNEILQAIESEETKS